MSTTYTSTIEVNVWKEHTCSCCGTKYRYLFKRTKQGSGATPDAATTNAHNAVIKALEHEVDMQPCPGCGSYQPDMIGNQRSGRHWWVFWCGLPVLALVVILSWADILSASTAGWTLGLVVGLSLLINVLIDFVNPNANTAANLELAKRREADGDLWVPEGIKDKEGDAIGSGIGFGHYLAYGMLLASMGAFFAQALVLLAIGGKPNASWYPQVLGPGDEGYLYFARRVECVGGHWRGTVDVQVLNAKELGLDGAALQIRGRTREDSWGQTISISRRGSKTSSPALWAYVAFPDDSRLVGKTVDLQINMRVNYPRLVGSDAYDDRHIEMISERHQVTLSSARSGSVSRTFWWIGLVGGFVCFFIGGIGVALSSSAFAKQANETRIFGPSEGGGRRDRSEDDEETDYRRDDEDDRPRRRRRDEDY
jgi:hypothetical protein